jgi:hypothetical protein
MFFHPSEVRAFLAFQSLAMFDRHGLDGLAIRCPQRVVVTVLRLSWALSAVSSLACGLWVALRVVIGESSVDNEAINPLQSLVLIGQALSYETCSLSGDNISAFDAFPSFDCSSTPAFLASNSTCSVKPFETASVETLSTFPPRTRSEPLTAVAARSKSCAVTCTPAASWGARCATWSGPRASGCRVCRASPPQSEGRSGGSTAWKSTPAPALGRTACGKCGKGVRLLGLHVLVFLGYVLVSLIPQLFELS